MYNYRNSWQPSPSSPSQKNMGLINLVSMGKYIFFFFQTFIVCCIFVVSVSCSAIRIQGNVIIEPTMMTFCPNTLDNKFSFFLHDNGWSQVGYSTMEIPPKYINGVLRSSYRNLFYSFSYPCNCYQWHLGTVV